MGNMAGVFVILLGAYIAVVGFRGTHTALAGGLFANATASDLTPQIPGNINIPGIKPANNKGVFV